MSEVMRKSHRQTRGSSRGHGIRVACVLAATWTWIGPATANEPIAASDPRMLVAGVTAPSQHATLSSVRPALIDRILADEGAATKAGEVVVALDDDVQAARTEIARVKAGSTSGIELALERWQRAKRELVRLVALHGGQFAASRGTDDARSEAEVARLNHELEVLAHTQAVLAHQYERQVLSDFRIRAPFDGYVTHHYKHGGETVDQLEGILTVIRIKPIDVWVDCPTYLATLIETGDGYTVTPLDEQWPAQPGIVTYVGRVIDGASQTFKVKLSVDNFDEVWPVGMEVLVDFSARLETSEDRHTAAPRASIQPAVFKR